MTSKLRVVTGPRGSGLECFSNWKEAFVTLTTGRETASGRPSVQPLQPAFPGGGRSSSRRLKSPPRVPRRPGTRPCPAGPPPGCRPPACQPRPGAGPGEPSRVRVAARRPGVHAPASHRHLDSRAVTVARDGGLPPSPPELDPRNTQLLFCAEGGAARPGRCVVTAVSSVLDGAVPAASAGMPPPAAPRLDSGCHPGVRHLTVLTTSPDAGGVRVWCRVSTPH